MHTDRTGSHTVFQWQDWDVQGSVLTWLDPWLREPAPHTQNPGHWHLLWSSHAHTSHLPLKELEKTAAQDRLAPKWWPQLTFSHFFLRTPHLTVRWMNRSSRDSCSTHPPSDWQGVPSKVDFYEVHFWQPYLVLESSFVGEKSQPLSILSPFTATGEITSLQ